jgi:UDP-glucuronate decarboxylase
MKILITGGAGFLGSNLSRQALSAGHEVVALDDLSTGDVSNIEDLILDPRYQFIEHDVRDKIGVNSDWIMNFACPASPIHYQHDPVKTIETNFLGMNNMLQLARKTGARVLQASTSEVYGDPVISPQIEEYWGNVNPIGIRSCYDEGKRAAETLCYDYRREHRLDVRVIRIFNTYGPGMAVNDGRVVSNFLVQALQGNPITIYGDGNQTRSFCYVDDLVRGIFQVLTSELMPSTPINLGNPTEFSMNELAQVVQRILKSETGIEYRELPQDDPRQRKPDISKALGLYGWRPEIELERGISRTAEYFKSKLKI